MSSVFTPQTMPELTVKVEPDPVKGTACPLMCTKHLLSQDSAAVKLALSSLAPAETVKVVRYVCQPFSPP
jgi:hypothetical protein